MTQITNPRILIASRIAWIVITLFTIGLFIAALPARLAQLMTDPFLLADGLERLGLSVQGFAVYGTAIDLLVAIGFVLIAASLYWLRSDDWMVWLMSLLMIMYLIAMLPVTTVLAETYVVWQLPMRLYRTFGFMVMLSALLVFPNGRLAPRIARFVLLLGLVYFVLSVIYPGLSPPTAFTDLVGAGNRQRAVPLFAFLLAVSAIQAYRYRNIYDPVQKQQVRWVVFALLGAFTILLLLLLPPLLLPELGTRGVAFTLYLLIGIPLLLFSSLLFPISVALAVLRYRLFDIDLIIRKTLQYGVLTVMLALLYFGLIVLLQTLFGWATGEQNPIIIVISTLVIAALFIPLRRRVQDVIDRRFFRKKYDAQQVLAQFAQTARDEVDMEVLQTELLRAVHETMQPKHLTVWIKPVTNRGHPITGKHSV